MTSVAIQGSHDQAKSQHSTMEDTQHSFYSLFSPVSAAKVERMCSHATESCCATSPFSQEQAQSRKLDCPRQNVLEESANVNLRNEVVSESQLADIYDDVGTCWRKLGGRLNIPGANIQNIDSEYPRSSDKASAVLFLWKQQEGSNATVGCLADALVFIKRKGIAEKLLGVRTSCSNCISQWSRRVDSEESNEALKIKEFEEIREKMVNLEAKVSKLSARNIELEDEGSKMSSRIVELKQEVSKISARNIELEEENQQLRARFLALKDAVAGTREHPVEQTDQATREFTIRCELNGINKRLHTHVTSPLEVSEVKEDEFDMAVKIDLLTRVTRSLQELYSAMQAMVWEACKCSEDTKTEYFDLAYCGLRAANNDLIQGINYLDSAQEMMSEEEKEHFQRLQTYQDNRQIQIEIMENLWKRLFRSHVDDLTGNKVRRDAFSGDMHRRRRCGQRRSLKK